MPRVSPNTETSPWVPFSPPAAESSHHLYLSIGTPKPNADKKYPCTQPHIPPFSLLNTAHVRWCDLRI